MDWAPASALGLDRAALSEIVKVSSGRSYGFEVYARLPTPFAFGHGAKLLAKDVRLLGEVLGADPSLRRLFATSPRRSLIWYTTGRTRR